MEPGMRSVLVILALVSCGTADTSPDSGVQVLVDGGEIEDGCNVVAGTGCAVGQKCTVQWSEDGATMEMIVCGVSGEAEPGEPCGIDPDTRVDDCVPRHVCIALGSDDRRCLEYCLASQNTCAEGECRPDVDEEVLWGTLGVCVP
jgi:hypothetical protein